MGIIKNIKNFVLPPVVSFYVLQPNKTHFIKDVGLSIPITGMENELHLEETILKLKKFELLIPKFEPTPVKTFFGMKDICFAYMPDKKSIVPLKTIFIDSEFKIIPEEYDIQYTRGLIRTYQDIHFKTESVWEKYAPFILMVIVVITMGIFIRMTYDKLENILKIFTQIETKVDGLGNKLGDLNVPKTPPQP